MTDYYVHFSYYNEEKGRFSESAYRTKADDQFEARRKAWEIFDKDTWRGPVACVKQCGVTWEPSSMDMRDYFIAQAAESNYRARLIENVNIPNAVILRDSALELKAKTELTYHWGRLNAISTIARDMGRSFDMKPPDIYDELHYVQDCIYMLYCIGDGPRHNALTDIAEKAAGWDNDAMFELKSLFRTGAVKLCGQMTVFSEEFGRDGFFPEKADVTDNESKYIMRWLNTSRIDQLSQLPVFGEKDVVPVNGSRNFLNTDALLVLRPDVLPKECQIPEYLLWKQLDSFPPMYARNLITNEYMEINGDDFIGALRPEYEKSIDFDALSQEYGFKYSKYDHIDRPFMDAYDYSLLDQHTTGNYIYDMEDTPEDDLDYAGS